MSAIDLTVNGRAHTVDVDPATPLLYVLSDDLALNGPKFGCGLGQCGACTVIVGGQAVRSCVTPVATIGRAEITTLEGLGTVERPHPIQQAFIDEQAAQCGFCLNGVVLTAKAFLDQNPNADRRADPAGDVDRAVPLFRPHAHAARHQAVRARAGPERRRREGRRAGSMTVSRRQFLKDSGVLVVGFSSVSALADAVAGGQGPFATQDRRVARQLDSWLAIAADGRVTAYTGKCELGQGIYTAQTQLVAEELSVPLSRVSLIQCDTSVTPDQGTTSGSQSTPTNFNQANLAQACATAREALLRLASARLGVPVDQLTVVDGVVGVQGDASRWAGYGELVGGKKFNLPLSPTAKRKSAGGWRVLGKPVPRRRHARRWRPGRSSSCTTCACRACCTGAWSDRRRSAPHWSASTRARSATCPGS